MTAGRPDAILLIGGGGHACVVADAVLRRGAEVVGFLDDALHPALADSPLSCPRLGAIMDLPVVAPSCRGAGVHAATGDNRRRAAWAQAARHTGMAYAAVLHPAAMVSPGARLGAGVFIGPGAVVGPGAIVEDGCIVNSAAVVEHHAHLGPFCHVAPGATLGGAAVVGAGALIGLGAIVLPGRRIGRDAVLGAGAVAVSDVPDGATAVGVPARWAGAPAMPHQDQGRPSPSPRA